MRKGKLLSTVLFSVFVVVLAACGHEGHTAESKTHTATGNVTAIDRQAGQITITHDPISSLDWPSMTIPFAIKDASLLDKVQTGDKVTFTLVEGENGQYVIQEIRRQ